MSQNPSNSGNRMNNAASVVRNEAGILSFSGFFFSLSKPLSAPSD